MSQFVLTIGGKAAPTAKFFDVLNPFDESLVDVCPEGTVELVDLAVRAARTAQRAWAALPDAERVAKLVQIAEIIETNRSELATLVTREQGKPQGGLGAKYEIGGAVAWTRATAALSLPEEVIQDDASGRIAITRKPVGVVASITPWNWPLLIATWHLMPALRVGCTVVIKPSPFTPLSTLRLVQLINEVLPPGVVNVVAGGSEVGNAMTSHPGVDKVVFTGSVGTGKKVMESASRSLKRLTLELGGNDAGIVLPGTQIEPLIEKLFWGCFINAGQTCAALKRLYVHESQYDDVVARFAEYVSRVPVGDGLDPRTVIGPISNRMQFEKVSALVEDARAQGARIVTGGKRSSARGWLYPLTVIANATDDMRVVREEQFGPVIPIIRYSSVDEAIERANSLDVGLGGSVWGDDANSAALYASRLECGTAWVNQHGALHPMAPFGGVKASGIGVEFNVDGLKEYTTVQVINVAR
ncbi:MAG: aldehyde dehydrogenase family protein [Gammaproteobacteria bacterium]